jgi:hypothetical protein
MRLSKTLGFVSVLALLLTGAGAVADDDHGRGDFGFGRDHDHDHDRDHDDNRPRTATPIKHVVVIFQENISFDHYFGTYPKAQNKPGETPFNAKPGTPAVNSFTNPLDVNHGFVPLKNIDLVNHNPNGDQSGRSEQCQPDAASCRGAERRQRFEPIPPHGGTGVDGRSGP